MPNPEITELDLKEARDAMVAGYSNCGLMRHLQPGHSGKPCDCDHGAINGCKARLNAIAEAIATARNSGPASVSKVITAELILAAFKRSCPECYECDAWNNRTVIDGCFDLKAIAEDLSASIDKPLPVYSIPQID